VYCRQQNRCVQNGGEGVFRNLPLKTPRRREDNIKMPPTKTDCAAVDNYELPLSLVAVCSVISQFK
jgi:hypothetical protein